MILKTHRFSDCIIYWYETCTRTWYCMLQDANGDQLNHCCPDAYHKEDILDTCADMQANHEQYNDAVIYGTARHTC